MESERLKTAFLILLVVAISVAFVAMIRAFLLTLLLAAIFSAMARPVYLGLESLTRGRKALSSVATIVLLLALIFAPLAGLVSIVTREAVRMSRSVRPWIEATIQEPSPLDAIVERLPFLEPYREQILTRASELLGNIGTVLASALSSVTAGTVLFFLHLFILLYSMFFFLSDGPRMLDATMRHLPLDQRDKERMLEKFTSVTRSMLKGTALIGLLEGGMAGLGFWAAGIDGAVFWGTLMVVLSILPAIGPALIWVPASILLVVRGQLWSGIGLMLYCGLLVGLLDNILRPHLVGRDTRMHDLLVMFSTLGGLALFGATGFIVGPILAALFITAWEMFGAAFGTAPAAGSVSPGLRRQ